jgi:O-antigen ligase
MILKCDILIKIGLFFTFLMTIGLFFSTALISISELFITIVWSVLIFFTGDIKNNLRFSFSLPFVIIGLTLFTWLTLQIFHSNSTFQESLEHLGKYRELLLLPLLLFFLRKSSKASYRLYYTFLFLMAFTVLHSWGQFFGIFTETLIGEQPHTSTLGRIAGAIMLAFSCFAYLEEALNAYRKTSKTWFIWGILFLMASIALLFFFEGRTGLVIYLTLAGLLGWRFLGTKGMLLNLFILLTLLSIAFFFNTGINKRLNESIMELSQLGQADFSQFVGYRSELYSKTWVLLPHALPLGAGTGSFSIDMAVAHAPLKVTFENPHNEYLLILYENGIVGLLLLVLFFIYTWLYTNKCSEKQKWLIRYLIITLAIGCLFNSLLLDNKEAHFYMLLLATLIGLANE